MWQYLQKRHAHSAPPAPHPFLAKPDELPAIAAENVGRTGYGEIRGELRNIMGGPTEEFDDFPKEMGKLERGRWFPWSLRDDYPPMMTTSAAQNHRIWNEMHMEQLLDHTPAHEVHASELPDYHYFSPINNELDHKLPKENAVTEVSQQYVKDVTDVPRFFRSGVPKLPRHEQDWYIPRTADGRFDWKRNNVQNGNTASLFDRRGWDRRFLLALNVPNPPIPHHTTGSRLWAQMPIFFRVSEGPLTKRLGRHFYASQVDKHLWFVCIYFGALLYISSKGGHWRQMVWENDPYNVDICFVSENRKKGGFHGII